MTLDFLSLEWYTFNVGGYTKYFILAIYLIMLAMIIYIIYDRKKYKMKFELKQGINRNRIRHYDKARLFKDANNVFWWKARKFKTAFGKIMPIPSNNCIEVDNKGRQCSTGYVADGGQIVWQEDKTTDINTHMIEPYMQEERVTYLHALKEIGNRGKRGIYETLAMFSLPIALVFIVIILVFGYGEFAEPVITKLKEETIQLEIMERIATKQDTMENNQQILIAEMGAKSKEDVPK